MLTEILLKALWKSFELLTETQTALNYHSMNYNCYTYQQSKPQVTRMRTNLEKFCQYILDFILTYSTGLHHTVSMHKHWTSQPIDQEGYLFCGMVAAPAQYAQQFGLPHWFEIHWG